MNVSLNLPCISARAMVLVAFALTGAAGGATIGPWPLEQTYLWDTQPIIGYTGGESSVDPPGGLNRLNMPVSITVDKNAGWLPYPNYDGERMVLAKLVLDPDTSVQAIHAKLYDPAIIGKSSWAIVLKDSSGHILDFGIRASLATAQIKDRQYDGVSWTNTTSPAFWTRYRGGNDYYTMDFTNNVDGTISWSMLYWNPTNTYTAGGTTFVTYTNITEIYLNVMTANETVAGLRTGGRSLV